MAARKEQLLYLWVPTNVARDIVFVLVASCIYCIYFQMSGSIRGGKKQREKIDSYWQHWDGNMGRYYMMKMGFLPGMGLGD